MGFYVVGILDAANVKGHIRVETGPINDATFDEVAGQAAAFLGVLPSILLGTLSYEELDAYDNVIDNSKATNVEARKIVRWRVTWVDNTPFLDPPDNTIPNPDYGKVFTDHIFTADSTLCTTGTNTLQFATGAGHTFQTAFEALARSKSNGQPLIQSIILLDR